MNNSASRFETQQSAQQAHWALPTSAGNPRGDGELSTFKMPLPARPLLAIQRRCFDKTSTICVCPDAQTTQRYYYEASCELFPSDHTPHIVHELMPAYQQEHVFETITANRDYALECPTVLFTSARFFDKLSLSHPDLMNDFDVILPDGTDLNPSVQDYDDPSVSCICLRAGAGGRWVLMDHESASTVSPLNPPDDETLRRLLRHQVELTGRRLAPYLATMFDVPHAWKAHPELASCALLVFNQGIFNTGCNQPGIPARIIWDSTLGLVWS